MHHAYRTGKSEATVNRILGVLFAILALLSILAVHEMISIGTLAVHPLNLAAVLAATLIVLSGLVARSGRLKRGILFALYILAATEIIFQALAIADLLPRIDTYSHVPFGRVYWTSEGHSNSMMNRYGWYFPPFRLESGSRRIVLIGDSMIQGVQVQRDENAGAALERLLRAGALPEAEVLACAHSGIGPTHYLELLRYAAEYLHPNEVIFCIFTGNDFVNVRRRNDEPVDPRDSQIYYYIDEGGHLRMHDGSVAAQRAMRRLLAYNHLSMPLQAYRVARGHCLTRAVLRRVLASVRRVRRGKQPEAKSGIGEDLQVLGLDDFIFRKNLDAAGLETIEIVNGILNECHRLARSQGITLRIVTIPVFPSFFFSQYRSGDWSLETDEYDFLLPEKALIDFARASNIPILPLGAYMRETETTVERIKNLYFYEGCGHFTPEGHRYLAGAISAAFYGTH